MDFLLADENPQKLLKWTRVLVVSASSPLYSMVDMGLLRMVIDRFEELAGVR